MKTLPSRYGLLLILIIYLLLGVTTSVIVPLGEAPDEMDHYLYVEYLLEKKTFPVMYPAFADNFTLEANQPPLYYLLGALVTGWVDIQESGRLPFNACFSFEPTDPGRQTFYRHSSAEKFPWQGTVLAFHLLRFLSIGLGAATVVLTYILGKQIDRYDARVALLAAALLAFNPQFIYIMASANNDNLTAVLGAAILLLCVKVAQSSFTSSSRHVLLLALLIGLGALTKFSLLGLWPLAFLAILWPAWQQRRIPWSHLAWLAGLPVVIAGWWYWHNYQLYGDPLVWAVHLAAKEAYVARADPLQTADLLDFIWIHFQTYWGWFGWLNIKLPLWVYLILAAMTGIALIGLLKKLQQNWSQLRSGRWPIAVTFSFLSVLIIYISLLRYIQTINWSGYQGRLAYTVAAPLAVFLAVGLISLMGSRRAQMVGSGLLILAVAVLVLVVSPAYPRPQIYRPDSPTAVFLSDCARFENRLELEAYDLAEPARPGTDLPITLYGYGLASSPAPQTMAVQIAGREGEVVGQAETDVTWQIGQVVSITLDVPVALEALPVRAVFQAGLLSPDGSWQMAASPNNRPLELPVSLGTVKLAPAVPIVAEPQQKVGAEFDSQLILLGYDLAMMETAVALTLYWQAVVPMSHDYTMFVHVLDEGGHLLSQHDSQPINGWYPTTIWDMGEVVADTITLPLPTEAGGSRPYQLAVGVYWLETLARLPVTRAGVHQPDDQLLLEFMGN